MNEGNTKCLYITSIVFVKKLIMQKLLAFSFGLYHTNINPIESYIVVNQKFNDPKIFVLWHDRLDHPRSSMMQRTIEHSHGNSLKNQKILLLNEYPCVSYSQGKLIVRPSFSKVVSRSRCSTRPGVRTRSRTRSSLLQILIQFLSQ